MNTTKIIIIILSLLLLCAAVFAIYYFFFQERTSDTSLAPGKEITIEPKPGPKPIPLSQERALAPVVDSSGKKVRYYTKATGNLFEVNFDGSGLSKISSANLAGLLKILWAPGKEKVIGFFQEGDAVKKYLHDYKLGQSTVLNEKVEQAAWSPDGQKIATLSYNTENKNNVISIANADGTNLKPIFQTRIKDLLLEWPTIDKISIKTKPSGLSEGLVITINPDNGDFTTVLNGVYGLNAQWSPLGNLLLYSMTTTNGKNISLFTVGQNGENKKSLNILGLVEKCVFLQDNRTIYCALPQKISENAIWPEDYYKGAVSTKDNFWKINLDTEEKSLIYSSGELDKSYDAIDLLLSPDEAYLFFINKKDGLLYSLQIK